jgi:hypothetical protein
LITRGRIYPLRNKKCSAATVSGGARRHADEFEAERERSQTPESEPSTMEVSTSE